MKSLHDAQAFEDARFSDLPVLPLPLESRRLETNFETWDDLISVDDVPSIAAELVTYNLNESGDASSLAVDSKFLFVGLSLSQRILRFDHFGVNRGILLGENSGAVTSLDSVFNTLLLAGFSDGSVCLFEGGVKVMELMPPSQTTTTSSSIFMVRFTQVISNTHFHCLAIDCEGTAFLFEVSKKFLLGFTSERKMLLDGRSEHGFGHVYASLVLLTPFCVGLALSCNTHTLVVKLEGELTRITNKWALPAMEDTSSCLAFSTKDKDVNGKSVLIARTCGKLVETCEVDSTSLEVLNTQVLLECESVVCSASFISPMCLSLLDDRFKLHMFEITTRQLLSQCDLSRVQFIPFVFLNEFKSMENAIRLVTQDEQLYCLGMGELVKLSLSSLDSRMNRFLTSGQWFEALTLGLKHRSTLGDARLVEVVTQFLLLHAQTQLLTQDIASICIEFALAISQESVIFNLVWDVFSQANKEQEELLPVLLIFVLHKRISGDIPPTCFTALLRHVMLKEDDTVLESFFLSLQQLPLFDLDGCIRLCVEKKLVTALCRFYNYALLDYVSPCQVIIPWISHQQNLGYRFLLYLSYSLLGVEFPFGVQPIAHIAPEVVSSQLISFFFPPFSNEPDNNDTAAAAALKICLEFDAHTFLHCVQQGILHSPYPERCFQWLVQVGSENAVVLLFVSRTVSSLSKRWDSLPAVLGNTHRAQVLFRFMVNQEPQLGKEAMERFSHDVVFYEDMLKTWEETPSVLRLLLLCKKLQAKQYATQRPKDLVKDWFYLVLKTQDPDIVLSFLQEHKDDSAAAHEWFVDMVTQESKRLLEMNSDAVAHTLFELQPNISLLLKDLTPLQQFVLLRPIVGAKAFGTEVTVEMANLFVRLLCEHDPDIAYQWLSNNEGRYNVEFALELCDRFHILNAKAYLLERLGRVTEALDLVLLNVPHDSTSLLVAIKLCESFGSELEWFRVLDACFHSTNAHMVDDALEAILPHVSVSSVIFRLDQFTHAKELLTVLQWYQREARISTLSKQIYWDDVTRSEHRKRAELGKGKRMLVSELAFRSPPLPVAADSLSRKEYVSVEKEFQDADGCWNAMEDPICLAQNLLVGTVYALELLPSPERYEKVYDCPELVDAGL